MSYHALNTNTYPKSNTIGLEVVGLNTLLVVLQTLSTSKMFKRSMIKNLTIWCSNTITRSAKRYISIFMSSVRISTSEFLYQKELVLT